MIDRVRIQALAEARARRDTARSLLELAQEEFDAKHRSLVEQIQVAAVAVSLHEGVLRQAAVDEYRATGQKAVAPGISVAVTKRVIYTMRDAFQWAKAKDIALALDTKAFEKIALATTLPFVQIEEIPSVRFAPDLGAALAKADLLGTEEVAP